MFTLAGSSRSSRMQAIACAANASFSSIRSICSIESPVRLRTFCVAGIGPSPMQLGSTPATAVATTRATGVTLPRPPPSFPVSSNAAAPSLIPLELAAVTVPPVRNAGLSCATASSVVPERGYSSLAKLVPSGRGTGTSSSGNTHSRSARSARRWLSTANASCSARPIVYRLARHLDRQTGEERRHAGDVAIVLACLVGAAEDHIVDRAGVDAGAFHHGLDRNRGEIIRPYPRQASPMLDDGGAQRGTDVRVGHRPIHTVFVSV